MRVCACEHFSHCVGDNGCLFGYPFISAETVPRVATNVIYFPYFVLLCFHPDCFYSPSSPWHFRSILNQPTRPTHGESSSPSIPWPRNTHVISLNTIADLCVCVALPLSLPPSLPLFSFPVPFLCLAYAPTCRMHVHVRSLLLLLLLLKKKTPHTAFSR